MNLLKTNSKIAKASDISKFILEAYGIKADVEYIEGVPAIKVENHFSMFSIVSKIRMDFSFTIFHKAKTNSYIIYLK